MESEGGKEQEKVIIARFLASLHPEESKKSSHSDNQGGPDRFTCNSMGPIPQALSLYPLHYETWAYSGSSTENEIYRMWQSAQLPELQGCGPPFPAVPAPLPSPQALPYMHSIIQPNPLYFMVSGQMRLPLVNAAMTTASNPSLNFSNHLIPAPSRVRSLVTIQEMQEDSEGSSTALGSGNNESVDKGECQEGEKQNTGKKHAKLDDTDHALKPPRQAAHFPDPSRLQDSEYKLENAREYLSADIRPHFTKRASLRKVSEPPFPNASPIRIRTVGPAPFMEARTQNFAHQTTVRPKFRTDVRLHAARPRMECGVPSRFIAPAVQIRSVVPVCSAPPARNIPSSSQEGQSSNSKEETTELVGTGTSELCELQI